MSYRFDGKVIVITGAGSGIGRATAVKLASLGAILALCDITEKGISALATEISKDTTTTHGTFVFDVGSSSACDENVGLIISKLGKIDHVFNCAGINPTEYSIQDTTDAYWDKLVNTNLKGSFNMTRACVPHLSSGSAFVNVSSTAGLRATAGFSVYCATKFGIIGFSKAMALELGPKGIRVNVVAPGPIDTPTNAAIVAGQEAIQKWTEGIALGRMGVPDEVADVVAFLFSSESRYMNGSVVEIHGGM